MPKIDKEFYKRAIADLQTDKLSPYISVRDLTKILYGENLIETLHKIRDLARLNSDDNIYGANYKRIRRMAHKVIREIEDTQQQTLNLM